MKKNIRFSFNLLKARDVEAEAGGISGGKAGGISGGEAFLESLENFWLLSSTFFATFQKISLVPIRRLRLKISPPELEVEANRKIFASTSLLKSKPTLN